MSDPGLHCIVGNSVKSEKVKSHTLDYTSLLFQIAASLLLFLEEEDTFWMMCAIIEDLLPASYYSSTLLGIQVRHGYFGE